MYVYISINAFTKKTNLLIKNFETNKKDSLFYIYPSFDVS